MKIPRPQIQRLLIGSVMLLLALPVFAQDYSVVPGKRVGSVRLGDTRAATIKALGKPSETKRWRSGLIKDSWLGLDKQPGAEDSQLFFKVVYRANLVVQIEFNNAKYKTANGISIDSTLAEFRAKHKRPRLSAFEYADGDGGGYAGYYYDDVAGGIAFSFGTQDYFDATVIPGELRVHEAGQPVVFDPGGKAIRGNDERPIEKAKDEFQHSRTSRRPSPNSIEIETAVRKFWEGLGHLDAEGMKELLDWPMIIVEASPAGNKQSVIRNSQEFDEEFKGTPEAAVKRGKSEFFGTRLSAFNVQILNANLASVAYLCQLPKDLVAANPGSREARFNALTVLRRDPQRGNKWRIVFFTVPK